LKILSDKTVAVFPRRTDTDTELKINNHTAQIDNKTKLFGFTFDSKLSWNAHKIFKIKTNCINGVITQKQNGSEKFKFAIIAITCCTYRVYFVVPF